MLAITRRIKANKALRNREGSLDLSIRGVLWRLLFLAVETSGRTRRAGSVSRALASFLIVP